MKRTLQWGCLALAALAVSGCSETRFLDMFGAGKDSAPRESAVRSGHNLAMPPDLQLKAPAGEASEDYQPNTAVASADTGADAGIYGGSGASGDGTSAAAEAPVVTAPPKTTTVASAPAAPSAAQPTGDIYDQYGISKTKPDGTQKTPEELKAELKAAIVAKKKQSDPNYGTIWNIGDIFKDG